MNEILQGVKWMITILILILLAGIFYFGTVFYRFDSSPFSKETGYTFFETLLNKEVHALKKLYDAVGRQKGDQRLLLNVKVDDSKQSNFSNAILIHTAGIFVIQLKFKKGWISGSEKNAEWIEQLHGGKVEQFTNPIHESLRMIYGISDLVPELDKKNYQSVVFFSNDCSFQQIEVTSETADVLKMSEITRWANALEGNQLSKEQIDTTYDALKSYSQLKK